MVGLVGCGPSIRDLDSIWVYFYIMAAVLQRIVLVICMVRTYASFAFYIHLYLCKCIWAEVIYIAFKVYNLSVRAFPWNHDLGIASIMFYCLSCMNVI